jgi:Protein of unknown function (DUF1499)
MTMKILVAIVLAVVSPLVSNVAAFTTTNHRRDLLQRAIVATTGAALVELSTPLPSEAAVITACPPKSKNCLTTTWTAPSGTKASSVMADILNTYPQDGQNGIDLGGWKFVENNLGNGGGRSSAKLEYTSGIGTFAKFFNGGKPFVDDMTVEVVVAAGGGVVNIKSASRIGESDLGVNQKRLQFLAAQARSKGWDAPDPTY